MTTAAEVRARIAEVMLDDPRDIIVGSILLKTHQSSAVKRIEAALTEFGGALLCDEVGMGKTYVAAAIAHAYSRVLVVAPAGLATMWRKALSRTSTSADLVSFEKLSRSVAASRSLVSPSGYDLVIVDEAQHARNRGTHRYAQLQQLVRAAGVLLLSATPIHNRREEMLALLSLFLGDRAKTLTPDEIARCVIRREHHQVQAAAPIPESLPAIQLGVADFPGPAAVATLRMRGVTHVTVNCALYRGDCDALLARIDGIADFRKVAEGRWQGQMVRLYEIVR